MKHLWIGGVAARGEPTDLEWVLAPGITAGVNGDGESRWNYTIDTELSWLPDEDEGPFEAFGAAVAKLRSRLNELASHALRWHLGFAESPLLWCVHVHGPSSLIPQPDRHTAELRVAEWNGKLYELMARDGRDAYAFVKMACVVELWPYEPDGHAKDLAEHGGNPEDIC